MMYTPDLVFLRNTVRIRIVENGKAYNDKCTNDNECSSKLCYNNGLCSKQDKGPSDSENTVNIAIINYGTFF